MIDRCGAHPWLGVCLDSAHLYGSGIDVGDPAVVDALLDELDATIGLARLQALHINDSAVELGSNRDRHANVGEGLIGERLSAFLGRPRLQELPARARDGRTRGQGPGRALHAASSSASGAWASATDMRIAIVDPQAYTPPYDDELCRSLAAAGAEVQLLTAHFTHGEAPQPHGYVRRELFGPPLAGLIERRPSSRVRVPLKATGHALGLARLVRHVRSWQRRRGALAVGAAAVARPARHEGRRARRGRDDLHGP